MKLISCHDGKLHTLNAAVDNGDGAAAWAGSPDAAFRTGLAALDALPPGGAFACGAVHELIGTPTGGTPMFLAAWLARCGGVKRRETRGDDETRGHGGKETKRAATSPVSLSLGPPVSSSDSDFPRAVVWCDPHGELYPPAVAAMGIPLRRLFVLHPADEAEQIWAVAECLRCRGVGAVIAALPERRKRLDRVEARRLRLAAERGGGIGLLLRQAGRGPAAPPPPEHAAVTRWLVRPEPGERNVQRWRLQLIFGHGGRVGQSVILEHHRDAPPAVPPRLEAHPVRPAAELADRPAVPQASRASG